MKKKRIESNMDYKNKFQVEVQGCIQLDREI